MKISTDFPPNYALIATVFVNCEVHMPIFCYGDTIFNPFKREIGPDLEVHEAVHSKQQGNNPDAWWGQYLTDETFRLEQETEAYGEQYVLAIKVGVRGKMLDWVKEKCAQGLSSELYGSLINYGQAESRLKKYAKSILSMS